MNANKKGNNPILTSLIKAGQNSEKSLINITANDSNLETENLKEKLPEEKEIDSPESENGKKLQEKKNDPSSTDDRKKEYVNIIKARNQKEPVEKANLYTQHRDLLKKIATAENISMQDLLANVIDNFKNQYEPQIKQSIKKLLL